MFNKKDSLLSNLSSEEKQVLNQNREQIHRAQEEEPKKLREHLQAFNDAVIAIIITIIVLEIEPPVNAFHYGEFLEDIGVFLIAFFIIADFWYDLHLDFTYFIYRPGKATAIMDFFLLADLALLPIMTKWIMRTPSSLAVANFGIIFFIAKLLRIGVQYIGAKPTMKDYRIMNILMTRSSLRRLSVILILNLALILLALVKPRLAMILYLAIPILSFIFPIENQANKYKQSKKSA